MSKFYLLIALAIIIKTRRTIIAISNIQSQGAFFGWVSWISSVCLFITIVSSRVSFNDNGTNDGMLVRFFNGFLMNNSSTEPALLFLSNFIVKLAESWAVAFALLANIVIE